MPPVKTREDEDEETALVRPACAFCCTASVVESWLTIPGSTGEPVGKEDFW